MVEPYYDREGITIYNCDCREVGTFLETGVIDSIVTDPPYGLEFMGKEWDHGVPGVHFWDLLKVVCRPGAMLLAFGGTRKFHRLACAIEDAGWEIRDCINWLYGCLSDDTEVLTKDGWELYHKAISKEILAYDPETDVYQWEKPSRWSEYRVESDTAYRIESDSTDQIVSRNHRCLVEREGVLSFVQAEELACVERVPYLQGDVPTLLQSCGELLLAGVLRQGEGLAEAGKVHSGTSVKVDLPCKQDDDATREIVFLLERYAAINKHATFRLSVFGRETTYERVAETIDKWTPERLTILT